MGLILLPAFALYVLITIITVVCAGSLESAVLALGSLIDPAFNKRIASEYDDDRNLLYEDIQSIKGNLPGSTSYTIEPLVATDSDGNWQPLFRPL